MGLSYRHIVSIFLLIFYVPSLFCAGFLTWRHGWKGSEIWFVLVTFSITRIVSASFDLATVTYPDETWLYIRAGVAAVDGLSPLLFAALGMLRRLLDIVNKKRAALLTLRHIRVMETLVTVAFILISIGYSSISKDEVRSGSIDHHSTSFAAAILFVISYAGIVLSTFVMYRYFPDIEDGEKRVFVGLAISLPLLLVRTVYLALDILGSKFEFSPISNSVTNYLCMAVLEEAAVMVMYLGIGFTLKIVVKKDIESAAAEEPPERSANMRSNYVEL